MDYIVSFFLPFTILFFVAFIATLPKILKDIIFEYKWKKYQKLLNSYSPIFNKTWVGINGKVHDLILF